ncbi:MAG TPA: ADP compounds hydrolase NudE [Sedimenticola thiotaurini]|uniref:ADP compounds hydrolase NudE n=1 Tax=Sedimenticola thiotaurini TaxID=1543721 RepID=A0A831RMC2_9GAMM|nr:ADP compounds hydrolase NudE [Sedimenticola thiotaurini]
MPDHPIIRNRRRIADTGIFRIEELDLQFSNGEERLYQRIVGSRRGAVMIVPLLDPETVLLIREYGAGMERYELGFPKGSIDAGEDMLQAADREIQEETGHAARRLELLRSVTVAPGYLFHTTHIILAADLYPQRREGDEPEPIEVVPWKIADFDRLLQRDDFTEARSIAAFYILREYLSRNPPS